ncbi:CDP-diacylglycerol--glycerol-3-phosphate 3-phosphatidyltransferase [Aeromicrobium sp. PE09-221]|uniref:CDP-alcohol phosphatidyltransferase family protein n=1 Tax=Aeromicrobium sp. PE09-221 TaxID=1898043 RepID=UPI000B3ECCF2|nr:CDP-alcohol phosphatidyltransferase family protein [Aeromicrobium sp. PE09-221]OUZ07961.1 CDP-diacylglycerol--glycerol-3-phosphate 3-phosphatidyltransferase [Aeromicrobium sp. PE09-221]
MTETDGAPPSNLNIANVLTVIRILGVPLFGWLLLVDGGQDEWLRVWSWVAFVALMATDKIDGDLARKHGLVTDFGKIADPIADKALTGMAFVGLAIIFDHWLFWTVTILMLVREWGITLMRFFMVRRGVVMPASRGGKLKTVLQAFAIGGYLLPFELWGNLVSDLLRWATHGVMAGTVIVTVVTGAHYVVEARRLAKAAAR